jgi:uncharacterized protein YijF (DUF1287 family)
MRTAHGRCASVVCSWVLIVWLGSPAFAEEAGTCLVRAARAQIGVTTSYDPTYRRIPYPNGDVPSDRGVCTDVVIRAYRDFGLDLQQLVHEDMREAWNAYPKLWGLARPDKNIDHRRVPNLRTFFTRHAQSLQVTRDPAKFRPGDIVTWKLTSGVPHIGFVSDRRTNEGVPLIIHNIGAGTVEEDVLFQFEITGHYRHIPDACDSGLMPTRTRASE